MDGFIDANHHATSGGFAAATGTAKLNGLASDDGRGGLAGVHGVGVHDPSHGLLVGANVRCRDIALGTEPVRKLRSVAAGEALEFVARHFAGIADDATLGAAEGNVNDRAFPGHPGGEGADFVEGDIGCEADAAFAGTADGGVQDAIADENFQLSIVHANGNVQSDFFIGIFKIAIDALLQTELIGGYFKTRLGVLVYIHFFRHWRVGHAKVSFVRTTVEQ